MTLTRIKSTGIAPNAIVTSSIEEESITAEKLAANSITSEKIENDSITTEKIAANAITEIQLPVTVLANLLVAGDNITIEPNGRISATVVGSGAGEEIFITMLSVGGGGGGGGWSAPPVKGGGGGGAGGLFYSTNVPLRKNTDYFYSVGGGGAGGLASPTTSDDGPAGTPGSNTFLMSVASVTEYGVSNISAAVVFCGGGGGGAQAYGPVNINPSEGLSVIAASGGGGGVSPSAFVAYGGVGSNLVYPYGTVIGYPGAAGSNVTTPAALIGGGGGGAGGIGTAGGPGPSVTSPSGGPGISIDYGSGSIEYAKGGTGKTPVAAAGAEGTGSGGSAGQGAPGSAVAYAGGSGKIVIQLPNTLVLSSTYEYTPNTEIKENYNTYEFTGSGIFRIISA